MDIKTVVCGEREEREKECIKRGGTWNDSTCTCVLDENKIDNRKDAIDNFIWELCIEKVESKVYPSYTSCMEREGYARRKIMDENPYQDQFLEPLYIEKIMHPTLLGDLRRYEKQYRYAGYIHARTKGDFGIVQADKYPPLDLRHVGEYISYKLKNKQEEEIVVF